MSALPSLADTRDIDPYPVYEELRAAGSTVRDEGMDAWAVLDHDGCTLVGRREDLFEEPTGSLPGADVISGRRELRALVGEQHDTLHASIARPWRPKPIEPFRAELMRPIVADRLAALGPSGSIELFHDLASSVPIRFIARVLGLPDDTDETLRRSKGWVEAVLAWRHTYGRDAEVRDAAIEATRSLGPMLLETIRARRERPTDDMISRLWAAGPEIADDWDEDDVLSNAMFLFEAGAETTSLLICTLVRFLLDEPAERRRAVLADPTELRWYTDEVMRHTTVVHWRARRATRDIEMDGVTIRAGDMVHPVNAAANRDPARWERPDEFDPTRSGIGGHLGFAVGPRHCAGAHLARLQATEAVTMLFDAFPDLALDSSEPPPGYLGFVSRAWRPVHLRFTPTTSELRT